LPDVPRSWLDVVGAVYMSFPWNDMYMKKIQLFMSQAYSDPLYERNYPIASVHWTENRNMEGFL
jgi:hypothetical protein